MLECGLEQIGEASGVSIPLYPNEHFYMITEDYKDLPKALPTFRDPDTFVRKRISWQNDAWYF